jgi:hypothetical protein
LIWLLLVLMLYPVLTTKKDWNSCSSSIRFSSNVAKQVDCNKHVMILIITTTTLMIVRSWSFNITIRYNWSFRWITLFIIILYLCSKLIILNFFIFLIYVNYLKLKYVIHLIKDSQEKQRLYYIIGWRSYWRTSSSSSYKQATVKSTIKITGKKTNSSH